MFITVLYGVVNTLLSVSDNEEILFNSHCKVQLLLESIKNSCHCENEGEVELADESGQVKNLLENQQRYASELLNERETCVLLGVTTKLGNWGESKVSSRKLKSKRSNRKSTVVITTPPEAGKLSTSPRRRAVKHENNSIISPLFFYTYPVNSCCAIATVST
ncbi:uncharacterized protein LOC142496672 isoform X3 [Ascaphus truei]|uniref:uncharacterized protein LOC142496672 isoform X3 n=1 Tax=Ascaphus truei TaxID=8439 RepID=UPI003F590441